MVQGTVARTHHETLVNKLYALALLLALVFFYASIPFVVMGLLFTTLLLLVLVMMSGNRGGGNDISVHVLRASGGSVFAVLKGLFTGIGVGTGGIKKTSRDCPRLYAALEEVARRVDTDAVDEVYLVPGSDVAVKQEGRGPFGVFGNKKRVLILGVCTMHSLTVSELKSILAHEYAHFSHHDTLYIRFLGQVSLSLHAAQVEMFRSGGFLTYLNPFFWFFYLYALSYRMLSAGFSRSREFMADRMACSLYGSDAFVSGLTKVCTEGTIFELQVYENVVEKVRKGKAFVNMYEAFRTFRSQA